MRKVIFAAWINFLKPQSWIIIFRFICKEKFIRPLSCKISSVHSVILERTTKGILEEKNKIVLHSTLRWESLQWPDARTAALFSWILIVASHNHLFQASIRWKHLDISITLHSQRTTRTAAPQVFNALFHKCASWRDSTSRMLFALYHISDRPSQPLLVLWSGEIQDRWSWRLQIKTISFSNVETPQIG